MSESADVKGLDIPISQLRPLHERKAQPRGYKRIVASIKVIGLIEPLCVFRESAVYVILDGYLRYLACKELEIEVVPCLVYKNKEAYTYNRMVNRLSFVQENRMLTKSLEHIDEATIAKTFGLKSIKGRLQKNLLKQLHPDVLKAFDSGRIARLCARHFTYVKPERQAVILREMIKVGDFSPAFARAMVVRTPAALRSKLAPKRKNPWDQEEVKKELCSKLVEVEQRYDFYTALYRQYVADLMKLCIYARKIITSERLQPHLAEKIPDVLKLLNGIVFDGEEKASAASAAVTLENQEVKS